MLAIIGASGQLGGSTLSALLSYSLLPPSQIVALTSSAPGSATWTGLESKGVVVRHASFSEPATFAAALAGVERLFLVSTPAISLDFDDDGRGRESQHIPVLEAARSAGVRHVYYSSLAFGRPSRAGVMRAHVETEKYLEENLPAGDGGNMGWTVIREGLYSESWPLYLGYFDRAESDDKIPLPGDGKACWTAVEDLGLANALVVTAPTERYRGRTFYLSTPPGMAVDMQGVAELVGKGLGRKLEIERVSSEGYEKYYTQQRGKPGPEIRWWMTTYDALNDSECLVDDPTLVELLASKGRTPIPMAETVAKMTKS